MSNPYMRDQGQQLDIVRHRVKRYEQLYYIVKTSKTTPRNVENKMIKVAEILQRDMDGLTPENYIFAFNNILTPVLRSFMRETPVMYLPPLRPFSKANMTRKNRRRRNRRNNSRR
jgi:hypothetical protein